MHVNLGFNRGAMLADPDGALAGSGKMIRHIAIHNQDDLNRICRRRSSKRASHAAREPEP